MAAADDEHFTRSIEFGAGVTPVGGELGESREYIKLSDGRRGAAQASGFGGDGRANVNKELALDFENTFVSCKDFALVFLKLRRSEALGIDKRLLAFIIRGR